MLIPTISPGDQHKPNGTATSNPFEESRPRVTEYTAQEIATLQSRLDKQLGPEYISNRAGPGGSKVHYLAADKAISLANQVFGFNGWSSSIQNIQIDFVDEHPQTGRVSLGLSVIVRVSLKDGAYHEDIGYGQIENCKGKAAAFEKAKKEGTTDALKRTLRNFGNVLGNCVYDKNYLAKVTKIKVGATKWDPDTLHRHADFARKKDEDLKTEMRVPLKEPSMEFDDAFDDADFDDFDKIDMEHPDEVLLPNEVTNSRAESGVAITTSDRLGPPGKSDLLTPSKPPNINTSGPRPLAGTSVPTTGPGSTIVPQPLPGQRASYPAPHTHSNKSSSLSEARVNFDPISRSSSPKLASNASHQTSGPLAPNTAVRRQVGFYSARAADVLDGNNNVVVADANAAPKFDPHAESPSIRKTSGVSHQRSAPLKRDLTVDTTPHHTNIINPQFDQARKAGASGTNHQLQTVRGSSTSAYRPPTRRGPETHGGGSGSVVTPGGGDREPPPTRRTPLSDVSNVQHSVTAITPDGADAKRQRVSQSDLSEVSGIESRNGGLA